MRLIDAEALEEEIIKTMRYVPKDAVLDVACMVNRAPTIEAKPVVHAHWKNIFCLITPYDEDDYEEARCKCSNCTMITDFEYDFCPYCGAQMDEEVSK